MSPEAQAEAFLDNEFVKSKTGYTRDELLAAFNLVCNSTDWKAPVDSYCTTDEVRVVAAAIEFFTATVPTFAYCLQLDDKDTRLHKILLGDKGLSLRSLEGRRLPEPGRFKTGDHIMYLQADGYRRGPAGDH